uniref:Uncharacterized protein n=1 Tax=Sciurus vulgaris TaxID=55149 RepID=A0A8D2DVD9_SCIVU
MSKSVKKLVEESPEKNQPEVDMSDRGISNMLDINRLFSLAHITQLVLRKPLDRSAPRTRKLGFNWSEASIQSREQSLGYPNC